MVKTDIITFDGGQKSDAPQRIRLFDHARSVLIGTTSHCGHGVVGLGDAERPANV